MKIGARTALISVIALALLLPGCRKSAEGSLKRQEAAKVATKPIDGYSAVKLGQSFNEVMAELGVSAEPLEIKQCYKDLPVDGCSLGTQIRGAPFQIRDGIPYRLDAEINKFDHVTDVNLRYSREGDIKSDECRSIHERTLDWLAGDYGPLIFADLQGKRRSFRTTGGHSYMTDVPDESGSWVTSAGRTFSGTMTPEIMKRPIVRWDGRRYVSLMTTYIVVNKPECDVFVSFSEPASVPRPDLMRSLSSEENGSPRSSSSSVNADEDIPYDENHVDE